MKTIIEKDGIIVKIIDKEVQVSDSRIVPDTATLKVGGVYKGSSRINCSTTDNLKNQFSKIEVQVSDLDVKIKDISKIDIKEK